MYAVRSVLHSWHAWSILQSPHSWHALFMGAGCWSSYRHDTCCGCGCCDRATPCGMHVQWVQGPLIAHHQACMWSGCRVLSSSSAPDGHVQWVQGALVQLHLLACAYVVLCWQLSSCCYHGGSTAGTQAAGYLLHHSMPLYWKQLACRVLQESHST